MTRTAPASAEPSPAPVETAGESHDRRRLHLDVTTGPIGPPTLGMRLRWFVFAVPAFTVGWAFAQVMGGKVGVGR